MSDDLVKSHIKWLRCDHELCNPILADRIETLIAERDALTDALVDAEAERNFWRQAASNGSIHTQADLDRAVAEARAVALQEAYLSGWVNGSNGIEPPDFGDPVFEKAPGD